MHISGTFYLSFTTILSGGYNHYPKLREVSKLALDHTADNWKCQALNPLGL